jgi:XRE family transcriptional regulator of biofilm formation
MFGERLHMLRQQKGLSVRQLARLAHVPHETISRLENTQQRSPSLPVAMRLAHALGVSLDYLAGMDQLYKAPENEA